MIKPYSSKWDALNDPDPQDTHQAYIDDLEDSNAKLQAELDACNKAGKDGKGLIKLSKHCATLEQELRDAKKQLEHLDTVVDIRTELIVTREKELAQAKKDIFKLHNQVIKQTNLLEDAKAEVLRLMSLQNFGDIIQPRRNTGI
jgi:chromosome segregation ATPase